MEPTLQNDQIVNKPPMPPQIPEKKWFHNRSLVILSVVTILLVILVTISLFTPNNSNIQPTQNNPSPSPEANLNPLQEKLYIFSASPSNNSSETYFPVTAVEITFSDLVLLDTFSYSVNPPVETTLKIKQGTNTLMISPKTEWKEGTTTITINQNTKSAKGSPLDQPYIYKINTKYPDNPPDVH